MLSQFKLKGGARMANAAIPQMAAAPKQTAPALGYEGSAATVSQPPVSPVDDNDPSQVIALDDKEFGKY
jgi:hypothetical protein